MPSSVTAMRARYLRWIVRSGRRALALAADEVGDRVDLISGIYTDNTLEARGACQGRQGRGCIRAPDLSSDALHVGAPASRPEMAVVVHFENHRRSHRPALIVFEYPPAIGIGYDPETLARLAEIDHVVGVKDWSNDMVALEANLRALRGTGRPVRC